MFEHTAFLFSLINVNFDCRDLVNTFGKREEEGQYIGRLVLKSPVILVRYEKLLLNSPIVVLFIYAVFLKKIIFITDKIFVTYF